jgi:carboxymethylenebutenolidase
MAERITFLVNGRSLGGHLALSWTRSCTRPWPGGHPGVVGPCSARRASRRSVIGEGFVALASDLYRGRTTKSPEEAGKLMMGLRSEDAARDLARAIDYVAARSDVASERIGVVGFWTGGALAFYAACRNAEVGACVVFYGGHPNLTPDLRALQAPMLGIYGARDKRHEFLTCTPAQHAFFNDDRAEVHEPAAAADAWTRTTALFHRELDS